MISKQPLLLAGLSALAASLHLRRDDDTVLVWDVMNEPSRTPEHTRFVVDAFDFIHLVRSSRLVGMQGSYTYIYIIDRKAHRRP